MLYTILLQKVVYNIGTKFRSNPVVCDLPTKAVAVVRRFTPQIF